MGFFYSIVRASVALLRMVVVVVTLIASMGIGAAEAIPPSSQAEVQFTHLLSEGMRLASLGKQIEAISFFEKVIAGYEEAYRGEEAKLYCARWPTESLMYLLEAANTHTSAKVVSINWAYAYYLKAYSLTELGSISEAKELLGKAIALSPRNSSFISELGSIYQREKDWPRALETFRAAESAAQEVSPPQEKNNDLSRAWRGFGFVYVEQSKFDEAEKMYRQCLELNSADSKALNELRYIQSQRATLSHQ